MVKSLVPILLGIIYSLGIILFLLGGGGHGSNFSALGIHPLWFGLIFHPILFILAFRSKEFWAKLLFLLLIGIHYVSIIIFYYLDGVDEFNYSMKLLEQKPDIVMVPILWYLGGQFLVWMIFLFRLIGKENLPSD